MKKTILLLIAGAFVLFACAQVDKTAEQNMAIAQRFVDEVWNNGNLELVNEMTAANFVRHNPASWDPPKVEGVDGFKDYINEVRTTYPDFHVEIHNRIAQGDYVAATWTVSGTNSESNVKISVRGMTMTRYLEGKAVEEWVSWDTHDLMKQLGMVPPTETTMN